MLRALPGHQPPPPPPKVFIVAVPFLAGEHLHLGVHSAESLDILAAADFDSVANSPRGVSHLGGLSNLGLSNFGLSNLELPGGGGGPEFSVGAFPGVTSSQRP